MGGSRYRPDIDGLRAVAVLSVMIYHLNANWLPGGFLGVDVFFVISGFVVTGALVASRAKSAPAFIAEFYARRLARIMPAVVVMLVVTALLATLFIPRAWLSELSERTAQYAFWGLSNWVMQQNDDAYFAPRAEFNPYTHTWSLGVEEQFYLVAPLVIFFWLHGRRTGLEKRRHLWFLGLLFALSLASFLGCVYATGAYPTAAFYFFGFRFWELGVGSLLYLLTLEHALPRSPLDRLPALVPVSGAALIVVAFALARTDRFPWPWALPAVFGSALLIGGIRADVAVPIRKQLAHPLMLWIGKRSYSLYLWHWPIYVLLRWTVGLQSVATQVAAVAASVGLAALSYRFVETPLRHHARIEHWKPRYRITLFLLLTAFGWLSARWIFEHAPDISFSVVTRNAVDWYAEGNMPFVNPTERRCQVDQQWISVEGGWEIRYVPRDCRVRSDGGAMHVLGDSHAGAYGPMAEQFAADTGRTVSVYLYPGCAFIDFRRPVLQQAAACSQFLRVVVQRVLDNSTQGDLLFLPSLRIDRYGDQWASFNRDVYEAMYNPGALKSRRAAEDDAHAWMEAFAEKGLLVIFEAPTPVFKAPTFRCSDWFNRHNPICVGKNRQPRAELQRLRDPIVKSMRDLASNFPNVSIWDPFPLLCPGEVCFTAKDGRPLFFDGDHVSGYGNSLLYPSFKAHVDGVQADRHPLPTGDE